jgi:hypothetical protein
MAVTDVFDDQYLPKTPCSACPEATIFQKDAYKRLRSMIAAGSVLLMVGMLLTNATDRRTEERIMPFH